MWEEWMITVWLGWMDGVKVALGNSWMAVKAARQWRSERVESPGPYVTECVSRCHFCLAQCSFGPPSRALTVSTWRGDGCCYMKRLWQIIQKAHLLKIKTQVSGKWAKGCMFDDLTWHEYPSLLEGESRGILLYTHLYINIVMTLKYQSEMNLWFLFWYEKLRCSVIYIIIILTNLK